MSRPAPIYCTRCAGQAPRATDSASIDPTRYLFVDCPTCELKTVGTSSLDLATRLVAAAAEQREIDRHRRHLIDGRTVRSCGRCLKSITDAAALGLRRR